MSLTKDISLSAVSKLSELDYVEKAGKEKVFAHCFEGNFAQSVCAVLDESE